MEENRDCFQPCGRQPSKHVAELVRSSTRRYAHPRHVIVSTFIQREGERAQISIRFRANDSALARSVKAERDMRELALLELSQQQSAYATREQQSQHALSSERRQALGAYELQAAQLRGAASTRPHRFSSRLFWRRRTLPLWPLATMLLKYTPSNHFSARSGPKSSPKTRQRECFSTPSNPQN